jgi:hypothetical protein
VRARGFGCVLGTLNYHQATYLLGTGLVPVSRKEPALGPETPTRYSACIVLHDSLKRPATKAACGERTSQKQFPAERAAEGRTWRSRKPEGRLWNLPCPLTRTIERSLWRAANRRPSIFGCDAEGRRFSEASGGGDCREGRSSKQADKRPPVEPQSSLKCSVEMPARRAEAR